MGTGRDGWPVLPDGVEPEDYKLVAARDLVLAPDGIKLYDLVLSGPGRGPMLAPFCKDGVTG